eukprot:TRINITY_DN17760_c0_g1_i1.p1 TRINITY_DN17760_c0_g1~~TRINITY_DN17760_c0_g1_i1.p1  ORF type:complete len:121 (+),score=0.30 TRINITY_DN17760_c0_g1_i1:1-363(+)
MILMYGLSEYISLGNVLLNMKLHAINGEYIEEATHSQRLLRHSTDWLTLFAQGTGLTPLLSISAAFWLINGLAVLFSPGGQTLLDSYLGTILLYSDKGPVFVQKPAKKLQFKPAPTAVAT